MDKENTKETDIKKVNLTQTASKGAFWSLLSSTVVSAVRFVVTAVLARLLMPEDFGLIGMALLVTQIVNLFGNLGLSAALIHRNKDVDDEDLSTSYWANLFVSTVLTLLAVIVSPIAARFFGEPRVQMIIALLSLNFIFSSFASIHSMLAFKDLKFKKIAIIEILCTLVRVFIVLILAFKGFGVWAIVSGILVERIVKSMTFISQNSWRPRLIFNKNKFKELFHFGKNLYAGSFISYFNCNMDYIVTGRFLGAADLGFYQFAFNIPNLIISHFTQKINEVLFPLYSKVKDDLSRVRRGYFKSIQLMAMIAFPFLMGLFFVAREFIIT
ncbi:MAG: lipopolysaccharide biosynthesis protein, partial [Candidatus Omnitrophica bacterium]|nr:lipopolysaccharide biosynthesis protein [Candidatus Omnitrophota bacterium]